MPRSLRNSHIVRGLVTAFVLFLILAPTASGDEILDPIELRVPPWSLEAEISLGVLLGPNATLTGSRAEDPPMFGQLTVVGDRLVYTPDPEFFIAGGDTFIVRGARERNFNVRQVLVTLMVPETEVELTGGFEDGSFANWSTVIGDVEISTTDPIAGGSSLRIDTSLGNSSYVGSLTHGGGTSNSHVGMVVDIDEPPGGGGGSGGAFEPVDFFLYRARTADDGSVRLQVRARRIPDGRLQARVEVTDEPCGGGLCGGGGWLDIPYGVPTRLDVWSNRELGSTTLRVTHPDGVALDTVAVGALIPTNSQHEFGYVEPDRALGGSMALDDLRVGFWNSSPGSPQPPSRMDLVDPFEDSVLKSHWVKIPQSSQAAAPVDGFGQPKSVSFDIDEVARQDDRRMTLVHRRSSPAEFWGCSFRLITKGLKLPQNTPIALLGGSSDWTTHGLGKEHLRLWLMERHDGYYLLGRAQDAAGVNHVTPFVKLGDGDRHAIALRWQSDARFGGLYLWTDVASAELRGIDTSGLDIESVRFGSFGVPEALGTGDHMLELDTWASWTGGD
ncbi:MAG: hypothetical protein AAGD06_22090 [Acidobacteriota bacterium]